MSAQSTAEGHGATPHRPDPAVTSSAIPPEPDWHPVKGPEERPTPPAFDRNLLPEVIRAWTTDEAERLGGPVEMVAIPAIVAAAALIGNTLRIRPKAFDKSWTETPNLYGAVISASATKKSPAIKHAMTFNHELQAAARDEQERTRHTRSAAATAAEAAIRQYEERLNTATGETQRSELEEKLAAERDRLEAAHSQARKYVTNDATIERVIDLLSQPINRGGLLIFRDELSGFFGKMNSSNHENDRPALLEGYDGKGSYDSERVMRGNTHVPTFTLSLLGGIQPSMLDKLISETRQQRRDDGLLERIQAAVWVDPNAVSSGLDRAPDTDACERARTTYVNLASRASAREVALPIRGFEPLDFEERAQQHFNVWSQRIHDEVAKQRRAGHDAFASHLSKSIATAARISLTLCELDRAAGNHHEAVSYAHVSMATGISDFLIEHARITYRPDLPLDIANLPPIWDLLQNREIVDGDNLREVNRTHQALGKTASALTRNLRPAEELGWIRIETVPNDGARPSRIVRVNPYITQPS